MIALTAPFALVGLAAAPILVWLHRRRSRPLVVDVPSLLFLEGEPDEVLAPERIRLDRELLLGLAAILCLALAAAGPVWTGAREGRTVRVGIDTGPAMSARSSAGSTPASRAQDAVRALRRELGEKDRLDLVTGTGSELLRLLREGGAGLRVLVSDRLPAEPLLGVKLVGVGDRETENAGIVAVDVFEGPSRERQLFVNVRNDASRPRRLSLNVGGREQALDVPAGEARSVIFSRAAYDDGAWDVALSDEGGALAVDDHVVLDPSPMPVAFATPAQGLPVEHAAAVRRALDSIAPQGWTETPDGAHLLWVGPRGSAPQGAAAVLELHPLPAGVAPFKPGPRASIEPMDPALGKDLDPAGCDLAFDPNVVGAAPYPLFRRHETIGRQVPHIEWFPDPLVGSPAPVDHPIWPLFLDNVLSALHGRRGPHGYRVTGALDPEGTWLGREDRPGDFAAWVASTPTAASRHDRPLSPVLVVAGAICLGLLWLAPRRRVR